MQREFKVHVLNERGKQKANAIAETFNDALERLMMFVPPCRELALVRTKLEEACFFAKKGMASDLTNTENT
jgi:hypothetical protein